jgi:hypothetical protein
VNADGSIVPPGVSTGAGVIEGGVVGAGDTVAGDTGVADGLDVGLGALGFDGAVLTKTLRSIGSSWCLLWMAKSVSSSFKVACKTSTSTLSCNLRLNDRFIPCPRHTPTRIR